MAQMGLECYIPPMEPVNKIDMTGQRYGFLVAIQHVGYTKGSSLWLWRCDCGTEKVIPRMDVVRKDKRPTVSCGHHRKTGMAFKHGHDIKGRVTREYKTWQGMKARCYNSRDKRYADWGGRGIRVCARWLNDFQAFLADMGPKPHGVLLDRINNDGNYEPENCRWATYSQQNRNRRPFRRAA